MTFSTHTQQYKVIYYVIVAVLIHFGFFFLLTRQDFEQSIVYEEISLEIPTHIPFVVTKPPEQEVAPKSRKKIESPNKVIEVVDKEIEKEDEEKVKEKIVVQDDKDAVPTDEINNQTTEEFIPFFSTDKKPGFLKQALLVFPLKEKRQGKTGLVIVEVDIDAHGKVRDIRVIKSEGENFDAAAVSMIKNSTFTPGYKNSKPTAVRMRFNVRFVLDN